MKTRREKTQIYKIHDEKGNIMTDTIEIQNIIRSYFENLYFSKIEHLKDIDKFLETYAPPKLNQEDIHDLNRSISSNEIEEAIKNYHPRKAQDQTDSQPSSTRPSKKNSLQYFSKYSRK